MSFNGVLAESRHDLSFISRDIQAFRARSIEPDSPKRAGVNCLFTKKRSSRRAHFVKRPFKLEILFCKAEKARRVCLRRADPDIAKHRPACSAQFGRRVHKRREISVQGSQPHTCKSSLPYPQTRPSLHRCSLITALGRQQHTPLPLVAADITVRLFTEHRCRLLLFYR